MAAAPAFRSTFVLDDKLVADVVKSTEDTFGQYFNLKPSERGHSINSELVFHSDVFAIIDILQSAPVGRFYCAFTESTIVQVISRVYGEEFISMTPAVIDGVGEISNTLFCLIKQQLTQRGHHFTHSAPPKMIVRGNSDKPFVIKSPSLLVPFVTKFGEFQVIITLGN